MVVVELVEVCNGDVDKGTNYGDHGMVGVGCRLCGAADLLSHT
jgi:hypothetical protein